MFSFDEIPDLQIRAAANAARHAVLAILRLSNHISYTASYRLQNPDYPASAWIGICEVGEDNVRRLAERCHALRVCIAPIGFDLCRALPIPKRIDGEDCNSVHHGVLERGESLLIRVLLQARWTGVVDWSEPELVLSTDSAPVKLEWLVIAEALAKDEAIQSVEQFTKDALRKIVDEATAAADKRGATDKESRKGTEMPGRKSWRPWGKEAKAIVRCLEDGVTDTNAITDRTGAGAANVYQVKRRWEQSKAQERKS